MRFCAALAVLLATTPGLAAPCHVEMRASVPIRQAGGLFTVPVMINGANADFILDTGAERTVVGEQAARQLRIARDEWVSTDMRGTGGRDRQRLGRPASFTLGSVALHRHTVAADNSVAVGPIPDDIAGHQVAGLLGQDFLSAYDIDIDPARGVLSLFDVAGCSGRFVPWTQPYLAMAAWRPIRNVLTIPVRVDGQALNGILDTGAVHTVITLPGMAALGLAQGGPGTASGFGRGSVSERMQHFGHVQIGGGPVEEADLQVSPIPTLRSTGALIGADWFGARRVWISWATNQVFAATR